MSELETKYVHELVLRTSIQRNAIFCQKHTKIYHLVYVFFQLVSLSFSIPPVSGAEKKGTVAGVYKKNKPRHFRAPDMGDCTSPVWG